MKIPLRIVLSLFFSVILLTACNTAAPKTEPASNPTTANNSEQKQTTEEPKNSNTTVEQPIADESDHTSITYITNGEIKTEKTTIVDSEKYSLRALPDFKITAEEPGRDLLYFEKNDAVSMRIEAMSKNDTSFNDIVANSKETMTAINEAYEPFDLTTYLKNHSNIKNSAAFIANFADDQVVTVVFENEDLLVRLTVFDKHKMDLTDALLKMGFSIDAK